MATEIIVPFLRGTTAQNEAYKGVQGQITIDVTRRTMRVHDGIETGGNEMLTRDMLDNVDGQVDAAAASAASAATQAAAAATSAGQANTSKNTAAASATAAGVSQTDAANSATTAGQQATIATDRATVATGAATAAVAAQTATTALLDSFRSVYLGEFASDPTTDAHGNPILDGAEYRNTVSNKIRVYRTPPGVWRDYTDDEQAALLNAQLSAAAAAASAGAALTSEQHAAQSEVAAASSKTSATASEAAALASKNAAASSATNAATSEGHAAASEAAALSSKNAAATSASAASASEASALASKNAAASSQDSASGSALSASTSLTKAQAWAAAPEDQVVETGLYSSRHYAAKALEQADRAQAVSDAVEDANIDAVSVHNDRLHVDEIMIDVAAAATAAEGSKTAAATSATNAAGSKTAAETAKTAAETARTGAETARDNAEGSATAAATSASAASDAASAAISARNAAATSASNAGAAETNAEDAQAVAVAARNDAVASLNEFKAHWFGALPSEPSVNPNGNPLAEGDYFWDLTADAMKVYNGTAWLNPLSNNAANVTVVPAGVIVSTNVQAAFGELGTAAKLNAGTGTVNVIKGDDGRLTDARPLLLSAMTGQVPVWNGTAWIAGVIVPGLTYFSETQATASPNNTVPVSQLTVTSASANSDLALLPKGNGALLAQTPNNAVSGGRKRGIYAVDLQRVRNDEFQVALGDYSGILSGRWNKAGGAYATIAGGSQNETSGSYSSVSGGEANKASNSWACVAGGRANTAGGANSIILGGSLNATSASGSVAIGGVYGNDRSVAGAVVKPGLVSSASGQRQQVTYLLTGLTSDASILPLTTDASTYSVSSGIKNSPVLPPNSCFFMQVKIIARDTSNGDARTFAGTVMFVRGSTEALTSRVNSTLATVSTSGSLTAAAPTFDADTTYGAIKVNVRGISGKTIQWLCHLDVLESTA